MKSIGALIVSAGEPQLERCLQAVYNQTVPFAHVVHIDNISPEHIAFNQGIKESVDEWIMKIDGDMILYSNAVEVALFHMVEEPDIFMYSYGLFDEFLQSPICGCGVFSKVAFQLVRYPNMLNDDEYSAKKLRRDGWIRKTPIREGVTIGTHFSEPDEFQVFRRFYATGVKHGRGGTGRRLVQLYEDTGNDLYKLASGALLFGTKERYYPTSHNIHFDREMYNKFKGEVDENYNFKSTQ